MEEEQHRIIESIVRSGSYEEPLPECKIKRNYNCPNCSFFTQNPRTHLTHLRDVHHQKVRIYDCPQCLYASKHFQKLVRHVKMVHAEEKDIADPKVEENEDAEDENGEDKQVTPSEALPDDATSEDDLTCSLCGFKAATRAKLGKHKKREHHFHRFFPCTKCNYVTHIRARFTKHVKYHNMPMIKCELCEFRTPYKWNLERHMKNHGGSGAYHCSECNFTADIKQSLTVHEMNHHLPRTPRPKLRKSATNKQLKLLAMTGESNTKPVKKQYVCKEMDLFRNKPPEESVMMTLSELEKLSKQFNTKEEPVVKKAKRPIPNLIPLQTDLNITITRSVQTIPKPNAKNDEILEQNMKTMDDSIDNASFEMSLKDESDDSSQPSAKSSFKRKNASFFDKLKEKLMTTSAEGGSLSCKDCGYTSKCLSEHSAHEKTCNFNESKVSVTAAGLGSTRCQHCRHRCKSSSDLIMHIQSCQLATKDRDTPVNRLDKIEVPINPEAEEEASIDDPQAPHPMENVVFVWNSMLHQSNSVMYENSSFNSKNSMQFDENIPKPAQQNAENNTENADMEGKKVFKCPQCPFWASTASRFHVHIVGHLNKKPFECSLCSYRSNWRWDITKHIRLKSVRDPNHHSARVLMTDETGRRNYSKYNKYMTIMKTSESSSEKNTSEEGGNLKTNKQTDSNEFSMSMMDESQDSEIVMISNDCEEDSRLRKNEDDSEKLRGSIWKCKQCSYRNISKEALLDHSKKFACHNQFIEQDISEISDDENLPDPYTGVLYRCGHCSQTSNWKHVIQRHCRLKHNGQVKVIVSHTDTNEKETIASDNFNVFVKEFKCAKCPFVAQGRPEYENHFKQHFICPDSLFKCFICSFYVNCESELVQHLQLHMDLQSNNSTPQQEQNNKPAPVQTQTNNEVSNSVPQVKRYKCSVCPYESNSKSQFMYHEQFHKMNVDAPFKCEICNYQVTKRHLLHQHMKVHGIYRDINDIQQVWVNFEGDYQKMFKCRHCPYVQLRKNNIQDHEQMHNNKNSSDETLLQCSECTYTCNNSDILFSHSKVHNVNYAKIVCAVNTTRSDEDQLAEIKKMDKCNEPVKKVVEEPVKKVVEVKKNMETKSPLTKILCFCKYCPARFLYEKELHIHTRFHTLRLPYQCKVCSYTARQHGHLMSHGTVHSSDYQTKTKSLQIAHPTHESFSQPKVILAVSGMNSEEPVWVAVIDCTKDTDIKDKYADSMAAKTTPKNYDCKECPAKFFKSSALHYHQSLHGGNGQYKCKQCNYAVKTIGNLVKHEAVHENNEISIPDHDSSEESYCNKSIPLSGTDLFQHKAEAEKRALTEQLITRPNDHFPPVLQADPQFGLLVHGNPDFVYPTYMKNGKHKEKKYKCHKCPSAFEKREQYKIHLTLHGSKQRYRCEICDYSVKYYANYVQHMRKHQMNADAQAARRPSDENQSSTEIPFAVKSIPRQFNKDFSKLSASDHQTLKLLHRKKSLNATPKEQSSDEKKLLRCSSCPYTNIRKDALDNHVRRHEHSSCNFECPYCKFSAPQSQFLRDHMKLHFNTHKYLVPEFYTNFMDLEIDAEFVDVNKDKSEKGIVIFNESMQTSSITEKNVETDMIFVDPETGATIEKP